MSSYLGGGGGGEGGEGEVSLFSLAHGRWRSRPGQLAQAERPNIYMRSAVCRGILVRIMAAYSSAV